MYMLNYLNAKKVVELAIDCNSVPIIIGEAGIGKTTMMHTIGKERDWAVFVLEANLLKEGSVK